jgi:hypothetical protein
VVVLLEVLLEVRSASVAVEEVEEESPSVVVLLEVLLEVRSASVAVEEVEERLCTVVVSVDVTSASVPVDDVEENSLVSIADEVKSIAVEEKSMSVPVADWSVDVAVEETSVEVVVSSSDVEANVEELRGSDVVSSSVEVDSGLFVDVDSVDDGMTEELKLEDAVEVAISASLVVGWLCPVGGVWSWYQTDEEARLSK